MSWGAAGWSPAVKSLAPPSAWPCNEEVAQLYSLELHHLMIHNLDSRWWMFQCWCKQSYLSMETKNKKIRINYELFHWHQSSNQIQRGSNNDVVSRCMDWLHDYISKSHPLSSGFNQNCGFPHWAHGFSSTRQINRFPAAKLSPRDRCAGPGSIGWSGSTSSWTRQRVASWTLRMQRSQRTVITTGIVASRLQSETGEPALLYWQPGGSSK